MALGAAVIVLVLVQQVIDGVRELGELTRSAKEV